MVNHSGGITGAPLVLLRLVEQLSERNDVAIRVVSREDGPVVERLARLVDVDVVPDPPQQPRLRVARALGPAYHVARHAYDARMRQALAGADLIHSNTITNGRALRALRAPHPPILTHVHELPRFLECFTSAGDLAVTVAASTAFIAPSREVHAFLTDKLDLSSDRIFSVRECVDAASLLRAAECWRPPEAANRYVTLVGTFDQRKGADLFVPLVRAAAKRVPATVCFRWIGADPESRLARVANDDLAASGLSERASIHAVSGDVLDRICESHAVVILSREDPQPLVAIEAAALGVPVICFADAGGTPDIVAAASGAVVPYLDLEAMADAIARFATPGKREKAQVDQGVLANHRAEVAAEQLLLVYRQVTNRA